MNITKLTEADAVAFTNFDNETSIVYRLLLCYLKDNEIKHLNPSNQIIISRYDYDKMDEKLTDKLIK